MKKLFSILLVLSLVFCLFTVSASAANSLSDYSDSQLKQLYEAVREEMLKRGLPLAQETTLREGKFIVGRYSARLLHAKMHSHFGRHLWRSVLLTG